MKASLSPRGAVLRLFRVIYGAGRRLRRRLTPAGQILLGTTLTAGALGVDTRQSLAHQLFALGMALLLTAFLLLVLHRGRYTVARQLPPLATMGQPFTYRLQLRAQSGVLEGGHGVVEELETVYPSPRAFRRADAMADGHHNWFDRKVGYPRFVALVHQGMGASIPEQTLPAGPAVAEVEVRITATPLRRGFIYFTGTRLARPEALGLARSLHHAAAPDRLLVLPRRYAVPRLALPGSRQEQPGGVTYSGHVGESEEFVATRDYRPGDPVRRIHWRGWARTGHPVVREYQDEFFVRHALALDTFSAAATPAFEEAISLAASYVVTLPRTDSLLDLVFVGNRPHRLTTGRGTGGEQHLLEALACLGPAGQDGFRTLADMLLGQASRVTGMVLVLVQWDAPRRRLVERLRAVGIHLVVFVVSPEKSIDAGPYGDGPRWLWHLRPGRIQEDLDRGPGAAPG
ncbi:MAG: DUF58 domain-containing protein [Gammaproteobacteria bacterium]|nr:DUF58 domain-containing protein [Gammaproteobacteria bacterium]